MKQALQDTICPKCKHKLHVSSSHFFCPQCNKSYPVINGIPILLNEEHSIVFENVDQRPVSSFRRWVRNLLQMTPDPQCSTATQANVKYLASHLGPTSKLLFIGGGIHSFGNHMDKLGASVLANCINLEVAMGPIVDIVADGHNIPFPDNYFEAIICQAVLEHTRDSKRVVAEMHRVLSPEGIVYAEVPFLYPVHMRSDFRRFTLIGIKELFSDFEIVRNGVNGAVASSFTLISINFFATLCSFNNSSLYQLGRFVFSWLFTPFKYLDWIIYKYDTATISPSGVYFIGRKKAYLA